jgi:DNA polymerase-3 subunit delta
MRVSPQDFLHRLQQPLPQVILAFGEEPLLIEETVDAARQAAAAQGFAERIVLNVEPGFDGGQLREHSLSLSLFASRRLLDLRIPGGRPGEAGTRAIDEFCQHGDADTVLLLVCGQLDARAKQAKWVKLVDKYGAVVEQRALRAGQFPGWIQARMRRRGLRADPEAVSLLGHYLEGNLLAAAQEIDKLALLCPEGVLDVTTVMSSIADQARFNVYGLADACLGGDAVKALRVLTGLQRAGVEPVLLIWALAREVRGLSRIAVGLRAGRSRPQLYKENNVWQQRARLIESALGRLRLGDLHDALQRLARLDRVLKGRQSGKLWLELEQTCLTLCQVRHAAQG